VQLGEANLEDARFTGADLRGVNLEAAYLSGAKLDTNLLAETNLEEVDFIHVRVRHPLGGEAEGMLRLMRCRSLAWCNGSARDGHVTNLQGRILPALLAEMCPHLGHLESLQLGDPYKFDSRLPRLETLPLEIGQLSQLRRLDTGMNALRELPHEIGLLRNLRVLDLVANHQLVTLPPEVGQLGALEWPDLRATAFREIPDELWNLTSLRSLRLGGKELQLLSPAIAQLTHLEELDISATGLTTFPTTIADLPRLRRLDINRVQLPVLSAADRPLRLSPQVQLHTALYDDSWGDWLYWTYTAIWDDN
jgi:hypothetical protein